MKAVDGFMISNFEYALYIQKKGMTPEIIFTPQVDEKVILKSNSELRKEYKDAKFFFDEKYDAITETEEIVEIIDKVYNNPTDAMLYIFFLNNKKYKLARDYFKKII